MSSQPQAAEAASVAVHQGEGPIHRNVALEGGKPLVGLYNPEVTTLWENWQYAAKHYPENRAIGSRAFLPTGKRGDYQWKTYAEIDERVRNMAAGLVGLNAQVGDRIGIYSLNNEEWIVTEQACYREGLVVVSIYDSLGADVVEYTTNHADIHIVVCEKTKVDNVLRSAPKCPGLQKLIVMGSEVTDKQRDAAAAVNVSISSMAEIEAQGKAAPVDPRPPQPQDLSTIMYTSGTTGDPKGVMITHANIIATCVGAIQQGLSSINGSDSYMSYLPLAHIMERLILSFLWSRGARVGFYQGDTTKIVEDAQAVQPSLFAGAPRVFNRIYDKVTANVAASGGIKRWMFNTAYAAKLAALKQGRGTPIWDALVFRKIRNMLLGPNLKIMVSGSAPLSAAVQDFLRVVFCCDVLQGYGLTETAAAVTLSGLGDTGTLHVGPPLVCSEIKLLDVPEMGYSSSENPPRGEVCIRGLNVFAGYYRNEEETRKALGADGWFRTGDVGRWNPDGTLSIIDRVKNIFKLSQGEYIAAEKLENVFVQSPLVAQAWVYGNSEQSCIVTVCVPDADQITKWAATNLNLQPADSAASASFVRDLCENQKVKEAVLADLARLCKENKFSSLEVPKAVHLEPELWSVDNGFMTPTFKLKRPQMVKRYRPVCDQMYQTMAAAAAAGPAPKK